MEAGSAAAATRSKMLGELPFKWNAIWKSGGTKASAGRCTSA
jgi:hypothetical protein